MGLFQNAGKKSRLVCENCMLQVERKILTRNNFFKKIFLFESKFGDRAKAFRTFGVTFIRQFCRNCFFVSMPMLKIYKHFLTKIYRPIVFFDSGQTCLVVSQKIFSKMVKTSFHVSTKTVEALMFLVEKFLRIIFEVWAENILLFVKTLFFEVEVLWIFPKRIFFAFENSNLYF